MLLWSETEVSMLHKHWSELNRTEFLVVSAVLLPASPAQAHVLWFVKWVLSHMTWVLPVAGPRDTWRRPSPLLSFQDLRWPPPEIRSRAPPESNVNGLDSRHQHEPRNLSRQVSSSAHPQVHQGLWLSSCLNQFIWQITASSAWESELPSCVIFSKLYMDTQSPFWALWCLPAENKPLYSRDRSWDR